MAKKRFDSLPAAALAAALGHRNVRTNSFSARLSAARQFGLLSLRSTAYSLTPVALKIVAKSGAALPQHLLQEAL
ncbi:MAG TPA: hypothetical protein VGY53_02705, partial [Isosphaeraceae bacterium]|nr:hypothetical protein [Isosphaeraceae bacterium]